MTPEAVVLQFDEAGLGSRVAAQVIDFTLRGLLGWLFGFVAVITADVGSAWIPATIAIFGAFAVVVLYPVAFEALWNGKTPGKAAFGLRVVTVEGAPIRFRHAAIRALIGLLEVVATTGIIASLFVLSTKRNQRLGDMAAGTLVMRERQAHKTPESVLFSPPPGSEDFAATLDVSALNADDYVTIRAFLLRATSLTSQARLDLGNQLGRTYLEKVKASPPHWMPAEMFLVCVVAAYQRRFSAT